MLTMILTQIQPGSKLQAGSGNFTVKPFGVNGAVVVNTPGKKCFSSLTSIGLGQSQTASTYAPLRVVQVAQ